MSGPDATRPSTRPDYEYHVVAFHEGDWCDDCRLPSMLVIEYVLIHWLDPSRWLGRITVRRCRDCDATFIDS